MVSQESIVATHRFGLGPRPGELALANSDPKGWLVEQISSAPSQSPSLSSSSEIHSLRRAFLEERQMEGQSRNALQKLNATQVLDIVSHVRFGFETESPFHERLVRFWTNHFAISTDDNLSTGIGGPFESEAIRPNVLGNFHDLLEASSKHPGMLNYLDNSRSIGPNSFFGERRDAGLNENLAREILELHTLGVNGGYSQEDVTSFAKIITGWTVSAERYADRINVEPGKFAFVDWLHEPGNHKVLGKSYREGGVEQGEAVLRDLATHPSTARHIATKLARHFVSDEPSEASISALEASFNRTGGDLKSLYETLIDLPEAWAPEAQKFRTPNEWLTAIFRATEAPVGERELQISITSFGHIPWRPGSPAGFPDVTSAWDSPDAIGKRIEWANTFSQRASSLDAGPIAETMFGEHIKTTYNATYDAMKRAESNQQALVMLLMSPAVMRR